MSMKKSFGYTLIELMTILAVVSILVSVGLPLMNVFFESNRMISNTNDCLLYTSDAADDN